MIDKTTIFEITRLKNLDWSERKIARHLRIDRTTVKKYLENPDRRFKKPPKRSSKLDPYLDLIDQWLDQDPEVKATVVLQRLHKNGFTGRITIVRDLLRKLRGPKKKRTGLYPLRVRSGSADADRLGSFWFTVIREHEPKTLCPGRAGGLQSHAVCRVYPQPKTKQSASMSAQCIFVLRRNPPGNCGRQHAHGRH